MGGTTMDELIKLIKERLYDETEKEKKFIMENAKWIEEQSERFEEEANKIIVDIVKTAEIVPKETLIDILQNKGNVFVNEFNVDHDGMCLDLRIGGFNILAVRPELNKGVYSFIVIVKKLQDKEKEE